MLWKQQKDILRLHRCLIQSHYAYVVTVGKIPHINDKASKTKNTLRVCFESSSN